MVAARDRCAAMEAEMARRDGEASALREQLQAAQARARSVVSGAALMWWRMPTSRSACSTGAAFASLSHILPRAGTAPATAFHVRSDAPG